LRLSGFKREVACARVVLLPSRETSLIALSAVWTAICGPVIEPVAGAVVGVGVAGAIVSVALGAVGLATAIVGTATVGGIVGDGVSTAGPVQATRNAQMRLIRTILIEFILLLSDAQTSWIGPLIVKNSQGGTRRAESLGVPPGPPI
jgi:hypothetical protein